MFYSAGKSLAAVTRFVMRHRIIVFLVIVTLILGPPLLGTLSDSNDDWFRRFITETSEFLNPHYDEVTSATFFPGLAQVPDDLSSARPTRPPCDRSSKTSLMEQMRQRKCSVIFVVNDYFFLFWGWEKPRKTAVGTNVQSAVSEIQGRLGPQYLESYSGAVPMSTILSGLYSDAPIAEEQQPASSPVHAETDATSTSGKEEPETISPSDVEDGEYYPQDSDRKVIPGFNHLLIFAPLAGSPSDAVGARFSIGDHSLTCDSASVRGGHFYCKASDAVLGVFDLDGTVLGRQTSANAGSKNLMRLKVTRSADGRDAKVSVLSLRWWAGD